MTAERTPRLGAKLRALRRREGLTQAQMAQKLDISPSYLNLIENERRPLTAQLLIKLAQAFGVDVATFAVDEEARLVADLMEVFGDPIFDEEGLTNADVRELVAASPAAGRAVVRLYRALRGARDHAQVLATRLADGDEVVGVARPILPTEEVTDLIERERNHFPTLEAAAEALWRDATLDPDDLYRGLCLYLERQHGVRVEVLRGRSSGESLRRYDPDKALITLSETLPLRSRAFQLAHQIAFLVARDVLDGVSSDRGLTTDESRALCRVALANYFAAAVLMPYEPFLKAAQTERYDLELLGHRFGASYEQVCHRLTTLRRPGREGVPFHYIRVDVAGNISKRFSGSGIRFARFSGACPRWNVFTAFLTPGMIRAQVSRMPDGDTYFCMARTVRSTVGGHHQPHALYAVGLGCQVHYARELVYADGMDVESEEALVPVGVTCRLCERVDCAQRAFPALQTTLEVDENLRGLSFFAPATGRAR